MVPYIILMFAPLLVYQVAVLRDEDTPRAGWFISIDKKPRNLNNSLVIPVFFLLYFILLSLRHELLGKDLLNYKMFFRNISTLDFPSVLQEEGDVLYWVLCWIIGQFTDDYQIFLTIIAAISVLPLAKLYCEDRQYGFMQIVLYMNMSNFIMLFSGLRQAVAMSFGLLAFSFVRKKKPLWFLFFALITIGFHHTGFMVLAYYPLYHMRLKKQHLVIVIPVIAAVFAFGRQIFQFASALAMSLMGDKYDVQVEETGAYTMIILFALFAAAAYFFPDDQKMDDDAYGMRNMLLMALLLQCFAPLHELAMRMNYYFILFVPIAVARTIKHSKDNIRLVADVARYVIVTFFAVYFLYTVYMSCQTGESALNTYPYRPFWDT